MFTKWQLLFILSYRQNFYHRDTDTLLSIALVLYYLNVSVFLCESSLLGIIFSLELKTFSICDNSNKKQLFSTCLFIPTGNFWKLHFNVAKLLEFLLKKYSSPSLSFIREIKKKKMRKGFPFNSMIWILKPHVTVKTILVI